MKKYISLLFAIFLSFLMCMQVYGIENSNTVNGVQKANVAYLQPKDSSSTVINDRLKLIYGLKQGISKSELLNQYVEPADGIEIIIENKIGTGTKLNIYDSISGEKVDTYSILIIGDVNGDGYYNAMDAVLVSCINSSLLPKSYFNSEFLIAADCNKNGQIDESDCNNLEMAGLYLEEIDQTFIYENPSNKYTVTFVDYDASTIISTEDVYEGESARLPNNPTKFGTAFLGWSGNYTNVCKNETVKAIYKDDENVFMVSSSSGNVGATVSLLVSVDGVVNLCGFDITVNYDPDLELLSYDEDLDLDIIANPNKVENGIKLNFSSNTNKTKQRDIIELVFKVKDTDKKSLPVNISITSAKKSVGKDYSDINYSIVNGVVNVND